MPDQYFANNRKVGDGVTTVWDFSFAGARPDTGDGTETYLEQPDVLVALVDFDTFGLETRTPVTTGVTFGPGPAQITVTPAIADGQEFVIYRDTLVETPVADFVDFASISEQDLDFSFRQALFVVQELADTTQDTENFARLALSTAGDAVNTTDSFVARVDELEADVENLLGTGVADLMYKNENLSGLPNIAAARANIGVKSIAESEQFAQATADAAVNAHVALADPHTQYAERALNLSDLPSAPTARDNLGLGSAAVQPDSRYNIRTSNLGDVADKAIARENLSVVERTSTLGAAVLPAGTTAQRPAGGAGLFRFNTELGGFEGFNGTDWVSPGVADASQVPYDGGTVGDALDTVQWRSKAIGELVAIWDHWSGAVAPPTNDPAFRYIRLTAGQSGTGGYNEGVLINETVSGTSPVINATATISLADSPLNGVSVHLINTTRQFLRPGASSSAQGHQLQSHSHGLSSIRSANSSQQVGTGGTDRYVGNTVYTSTGSTGGDETRPRNVGVTYYLRIK